MEYTHTQSAPLWLLLLATGVAMLISAAFIEQQDAIATMMMAGVGGLMLVLACSFRELTVSDQGEYLRIQFGPLPLFGRSIPYSSITAAEAGRSRLVDGWGIHWVPGRGWTFSLWGFDCIVLHLGSRIVRIGTDDVDGLLSFLQSRIA